jgi:diketogulonate reductase-like aldo/keto reductase
MPQATIGAQASRLARDHTLLGSTATRMPKLIYGTAWKADKTADLVYNAIRAGFRGIDTAAQPKHYQEAGAASGVRRAIAESIVTRDDLFVSISSCDDSMMNVRYISHFP